MQMHLILGRQLILPLGPHCSWKLVSYIKS